MRRDCLILLPLLLAAANLSAAEDPDAETGNTLVYDGAFFAQYRPLTALDMLRWVPGVADIVPSEGDGGGGGQRGFGSDGEVRARAAEISALSPLARGGERS